MVGAHPFGGFNMSGTDSKAGGSDYLLLFTQAKSIAEKIMPPWQRYGGRWGCRYRSGFSRCHALLLPAISRGLHLEEISGLGGSLGQDAVVNGEEGQFQAVRHAGLVVDGAQIVFDDLLFGA